MITGNGIECVRHLYKVEKTLKSYTIYRLDEADNPSRIKLSHVVRLEPFRGKSKATGIKLILKGKEGAKWAQKTITGLKPTDKPLLFSGDHLNGSKSLLIIQLSDDRSTLVIDYYNNWYPYNPQVLKNLVQSHYN